MDSTPRRAIHPLVAAAAVAVIIFSAVGIGAITGIIPTSKSKIEPPLAADTSTATVPAPTASAPPVKAVAPAAPPARSAAPRVAAEQPPAPVVNRDPARVAAAERATPAAVPICVDCGTVQAVREMKHTGDGSGVGAVAGGVAGAVLGRQVGGGRGRDLATVAGAVGGAVAGHQIERHVKSSTAYEIIVRMDDGSVRTLTQGTPPTWRAGDKVRVQGDRLTTQG